MRYTYNWQHLYVSSHFSLLARALQAPMGAYSAHNGNQISNYCGQQHCLLVITPASGACVHAYSGSSQCLLLTLLTLAGYDYNISGILPQIGGFPFTQHLSVIDTYVSDNWCVFIPIIDDGEMEGNETFTVELFTPSVEVVAIRETACVTIVDNDGRYCKLLI